MDFKALHALKDGVARHQEILLANALMLGEIPAPSGQEMQRAHFLSERLLQSSAHEVACDEVGNVEAIIPGEEGSRNILVTSHIDTSLEITPSQRIAINVGASKMVGPGMADNTLGLAALATLPDLLEKLGVKFQSNLVLLGHVKSQGRYDLSGMRFFLEHCPESIDAGLVIEGITLGRLNHHCLGMVQAEIHCKVHQSPESRWEASENAIIILHRVIKRILEIPLPQEPRTSIIIGSIEGGKTFNRPPSIAHLKLEIRSEERGRARKIRMRIKEILEEISAETASECQIQFPALRKPGGIPFNHPYVAGARKIQEKLGISTLGGPSFSDLSALISHGIPALTVGLTKARNLLEENEEVELSPVHTGLAQVIGILKMMDEAHLDPVEEFSDVAE